MLRIVADLGNSRLKWGRLDAACNVVESATLPLDDPRSWASTWSSWNPSNDPARWYISSVNPPVAEVLGNSLTSFGRMELCWFRSAAEVPVKHALEHPQITGADRALAVSAAVAQNPDPPGIIVSCGTAITVERVDETGTWQGGAIAPGLGLAARALHLQTAQLPLVVPREAPPAWGASTLPALEAGIFWGVVGAVRELLTHQAASFKSLPWLVWTGGDAATLAPAITWPSSSVVPDLVLQGLARIMASDDLKG